MSDKSVRTVSASQLIATIQTDDKLAAKVLGKRGILSDRKVWRSKHMARMFYRPFGIKLSSPFSKLANDTKAGRKLTAADTREKLKARLTSLPGITAAPNMDDALKKKVTDISNKAKKGGPAYLIAASGCIISKTPSFIAAGVAGVQLMQVMPLVMEIIIGPEGRLRSAAVEDGEQAFTDAEMDMIGTVLTEKTPRKSDGKMTAAVDSIYLQQAMGVNTANVPVSEYAPGYSVLNDPSMSAGLAAQRAAEPACDVILSTKAMYAALAADVAATAAIAFVTAGVGGVITALAKMAASAITAQVILAVVTAGGAALAAKLIKDIAGELPEARGEELGDILGVSALTFFGAGGLSNMASALRESDVEFMNKDLARLEQIEKRYDIAELSPFDVTSKYTMLGSMVNTLRMTAITNGTKANPLTNVFSSVFGGAKSALAGETSYAAEPIKCYTEEFLISGDDPVCHDSSGVPISYQTSEQAAMSTKQAQEIVDKAGWIDEDIDVPEGATLDDMVQSGYIKPDTLLAEWVTTCGTDLMQSGDYLFMSDSCTATPGVTGTPSGTQFNQPVYEDESEESSEIPGRTIEPTTTDLEVQAITPALVGFITTQSLNGVNDIEDETTVASSAGTPGTAEGCGLPATLTKAVGEWGGHSNGRIPQDQLAKLSWTNHYLNTSAACSLEVVNEKFKAEFGRNIAFSGPRSAYRSYAEQVQMKAERGRFAATPGTSNHGWGLAGDLSGGINSFGTAEHNWMKANAPKYGWVHPPFARQGGGKEEAWHWEYGRPVD